MNSKERILKVIKHEKADKIPVDLGGSLPTGINVKAYNGLKQALGIKSCNLEIFDSMFMIAKVEKEIIENLQIDVVPISSPYDCMYLRNFIAKKETILPNGLKCLISEDYKPERQRDGSNIFKKNGFIFKFPRNGFYHDVTKYALEDIKSVKDIDRLFDFSGYSDIEENYFLEQSKKLKGTDKAVIGDIFASFSAEDVFGYEKALMSLLVDKKLHMYFVERLTDMFINNFDIFNRSMGDVADILLIYKDMGHQDGPIISTDVANEFFFPLFKKFISHVKSKSNYYVMMHNCGSIYNFIPGLIDCGVDILNPIQFTAKNMELQRLQREFGKYICFWGGGIDTQKILPYGTEKEVRKQVKENAFILSKNDGFVFNPVHIIQSGVPAENIIAAYDEINKIVF